MHTNNSLQTLLAQCLREDVNGYTVTELLKEFPTMHELMNATEDEMKLIKGIGAAKAKQLCSILAFVRYAQANPEGMNRLVISSPQDAYNLMRSEMEYLQVEQFRILGLNTKNHVMFQHIVSTGTLNASLVHARETFRTLIRRACAATILVHNHPSGDPTPSHDDIALTKSLFQSGEIIGINVLDHIIVGQGRYVSFKEKGLI